MAPDASCILQVIKAHYLEGEGAAERPAGFAVDVKTAVKRLAAETMRRMARDEDLRVDGRTTRQVTRARGERRQETKEGRKEGGKQDKRRNEGRNDGTRDKGSRRSASLVLRKGRREKKRADARAREGKRAEGRTREEARRRTHQRRSAPTGEGPLRPGPDAPERNELRLS